MTDFRTKGLGRIAKPDVRDRNFLLATPPKRPTRTTRSWNVRGGALDQGETPMCVGYSTAQWVHASPQSEKLPDPVWLYGEAQKNDETPGEAYDGSTVRGAFKALKADGIISSYEWAFDAATCLYHILETGPLVLGTNWYDGMFDPDYSGNLHVTGGIAGGHAFLAIGASQVHWNRDGTQGAVRILNSWGPTWGDHGRAWMSLRDLDRLLHEDGESGMGVKLLPGAKPAVAAAA